MIGKCIFINAKLDLCAELYTDTVEYVGMLFLVHLWINCTNDPSTAPQHSALN